MKKFVSILVLLFSCGTALAANDLPGDRELLATYCSVVVDNKLNAMTAVARWQAKDNNATRDLIEMTSKIIADLQDNKQQLDSFLKPISIAAQESKGSAYAAALQEARGRADRDTLDAKGLTDAAGKRLARCSDLSWLP